MLSELVAALRAWADGAGAAGVLAISAVDSGLIALPNATDLLIMYLTVSHPAWWWWYALVGVFGAVAGSLPLYWIGRRGGDALIRRRLSGSRSTAVMAWYSRSAFGAILIGASLPPPMPFKAFVMAAGATALPAWRFAVAMGLGRSVRHFSEAALARLYGDEAVQMMQTHGGTVAAVLIAGGVVATGGVLLWKRNA